MNKVISGVVSILFVLAFAGITFSAQQEKAMKMFAGQITAIDAKAKTITVKEDKKGAFTCVIDGKTVIRINNKGQSTFDDLKIGDIAALIYEDRDGRNVVKSMTVIPWSSVSSTGDKTKTPNPVEKK